jgi:tetratricopeptide (TPR) repeat protein
MATLESDDSNIIDGETINLRLVVYPILAAIILILGGFGYYYYQQNERNNEEAAARAALLQAQTPEALVQVADQFPHTDQATLALLKAADDSFAKLDYTAATKDYQRIIDTASTDPLLRDSAQLGLASALEANGKIDEAITTYLEVAHRGDKTPYAPFGYNAVSRIYAQRGDVENERKILVEETSLDPDSEFVKQAQQRLKEMSSSSLVMPVQSSPAVPAKP